MRLTTGQAPNAAQQFYRVMGDWPGGGFGYTMPFRSEAEARAWGERKAGIHRSEADIRVVHRGPAFSEAELIAADRARNADKAERLNADNEACALAQQIHQLRCMGVL